MPSVLPRGRATRVARILRIEDRAEDIDDADPVLASARNWGVADDKQARTRTNKIRKLIAAERSSCTRITSTGLATS